MQCKKITSQTAVLGKKKTTLNTKHWCCPPWQFKGQMLTCSNALGIALHKSTWLFCYAGGNSRIVRWHLQIPRMTLNTLNIHVLKFKLAGRRPAVKRLHCSAVLKKKQNVCVSIFPNPPSHSKKSTMLCWSRPICTILDDQQHIEEANITMDTLRYTKCSCSTRSSNGRSPKSGWLFILMRGK